ncbi:MAG TPA: hypothetical protein ENK99_05480 [Campylobacterales bacterium]|nr:hypothetical protein [Campylobacterales bacterium]
MNWKSILEWAGKFLGMILPMVTPEIKKELFDLLKKLHEKALQTDNVFDDYLTQFLLDLFGIK